MALGLLVGVGYGLLGAGVDATTCNEGEAQMRAVWGEPERQQFRAASTATGVVFAADTAARIEAQLDGYARAWRNISRVACAAHRGGQMSDTLITRQPANIRPRAGAPRLAQPRGHNMRPATPGRETCRSMRRVVVVSSLALACTVCEADARRCRRPVVGLHRRRHVVASMLCYVRPARYNPAGPGS